MDLEEFMMKKTLNLNQMKEVKKYSTVILLGLLFFTSCKHDINVSDNVKISYEYLNFKFFDEGKQLLIDNEPYFGFVITVENNSKSFLNLEKSEVFLKHDLNKYAVDLLEIKNLNTRQISNLKIPPESNRTYIIPFPISPVNMTEAKRMTSEFNDAVLILENVKIQENIFNYTFRLSNCNFHRIKYTVDGKNVSEKEFIKYKNFIF